jgi:hypothetical protein
MPSSELTEVLRSGLARILDAWRDTEAGALDPLQNVLRLQLAAATGHHAGSARGSEADADVARAYETIQRYFDNVRYALLNPVAMVWGTVTNALRVAAAVDSVTPAQRATFVFSADSLAAFLRAAHGEPGLAETLWRAFRPMPATDCQTLAALLDPHLDAHLDGPTVVALVRLLGNEGPLTSHEAEAMATLRRTGLISAAFVGVRGGG